MNVVKVSRNLNYLLTTRILSFPSNLDGAKFQLCHLIKDHLAAHAPKEADLEHTSIHNALGPRHDIHHRYTASSLLGSCSAGSAYVHLFRRSRVPLPAPSQPSLRVSRIYRTHSLKGRILPYMTSGLSNNGSGSRGIVETAMMRACIVERAKATIFHLPACSLQVVATSVLAGRVPHYVRVGAAIAGTIVSGDVLFAHVNCLYH
jgi:hypothetical protein